MEITFFIARHGESVYNKLKLVQGQCNPGLTKMGENQATRLAKRLSQYRFNRVYTSDLKRAKQTTDIIMEYNEHKVVQITQDARVKEINLGVWQGWPIHMLLAAIADAGYQFTTYQAEDGESFEKMQARAVEFVEEISRQISQSQPKENVQCKSKVQILLVIHGLVIGQLAKHFNAKYGTKLISTGRGRDSPQNSSLSQFTLTLNDEGAIVDVECLLLNDDAHLLTAQGSPTF